MSRRQQCDRKSRVLRQQPLEFLLPPHESVLLKTKGMRTGSGFLSQTRAQKLRKDLWSQEATWTSCWRRAKIW